MFSAFMSFCFPEKTTAFQLAILAVSALLVGVNKSGIPGLGMLPVILLAVAFDANPGPGFATGVMLLMICAGDIFAISYYRKNADWKIVLRLLPYTMAGLALGFATLRFLNRPEHLRMMIGWIILLLAAVHLIRIAFFKSADVPKHWAFSAVVGLAAGFTTQVANAAGPVMALYLLSMKLPKERYVGTCAWFFMIMNWTKLPVFCFEGRVGFETLRAVLPMLPLILAGAFLGVLFVKRAPQKFFEAVVEVIVIVSAVKLLWPSSRADNPGQASDPEPEPAHISAPANPDTSAVPDTPVIPDAPGPVGPVGGEQPLSLLPPPHTHGALSHENQPFARI